MTGDRTIIGALSAKADSAEAQRTLMFAKIDDLQKEQAKLVVMVNDMKSGFEDMREDIDNFKALEQRGRGILAVVGLGGGGIGAAIATFGEVLWN